ncbi:MAG: spermidine/putrescine ABC transporter substrate-binding protein, partial [Gordonia polyisoprenivorans]|nr:spermidine/putrescine ABC transporter substrate-binding protein [Gordonia polyisoprenivorans]
AASLDPLARGASAVERYWDRQKPTKQLDFANWSLYIDVDDKNDNKHPSLDEFTRKTGIKVKYDEVIADDDSYFGKIQPLLGSGQGTGYDLMVITNGRYLDQLIDLNYLIPLDQRRMTMFRRYADQSVRDPSYDPGNKYSMAWQSGITGIAYDPKRTGRKITKWADLQDPKFRGRVGMFGDTEDLPNSAIAAVGVNPERSTPDDWRRAAQWLRRQQPLVRKYYEQDYIEPLVKGNIWASMAWSGDVFQANASSGSKLEFVVPEEGGVIWTDNMCIPRFANNPRSAMTYMDYVYRPRVAADIAEYVNYITPVPATRKMIRSDAADASGDDRDALGDLADSPLVFPPEADLRRLHRYRVLKNDDELRTWNNLFEPIYQS